MMTLKNYQVILLNCFMDHEEPGNIKIIVQEKDCNSISEMIATTNFTISSIKNSLCDKSSIYYGHGLEMTNEIIAEENIRLLLDDEDYDFVVAVNPNDDGYAVIIKIVPEGAIRV